MKGVLPDQLVNLNCQIILANTYHLGMRPVTSIIKMQPQHNTARNNFFFKYRFQGIEALKKVGGLHNFMSWPRALLTDSGGFQMVSLLKLAEINETGVNFKSPFDNSQCLLTPEHSIEIQNTIGADIMMQLDDVVKTTTTGPRVEEAMHRTLRWLDRCIEADSRCDDQSIFPIVQGGLDPVLREQCAKEIVKRNVRGFAVGGLSGGESKDEFWPTVHLCTDYLPENKPRYLMGVGFAADLVVCVALGIDMFDCVFPTRTARFGCALVAEGQINLKQQQYAEDVRPIDNECMCSTCKTYTRSYLHHIVTHEPVACSILSVHNIAYQLRLMRDIRTSIEQDKFPDYIRAFMQKQFPDDTVPTWIRNALAAVNVNLSID